MTRFNRSELKKRVRGLISDLIRGRRAFVRSSRLHGKVYLNVGCGRNSKADFINIDYTWQPGVDLCWDITKGLPLPSGSMESIYTEHCLEHIGYFECVQVLKEFYRVLRPGGRVRIVVPDGGLYLDLYQRSRLGEAVEFPYVGEAGQKDLQEDSLIGFTPMMAVNRIFRSYGHQFAYDAQTFEAILKHVGFDVSTR